MAGKALALGAFKARSKGWDWSMGSIHTKTPNMGGSIRAQRGRARSALFGELTLKKQKEIFSDQP